MAQHPMTKKLMRDQQQTAQHKGVYVTLGELVSLRGQGHGFSFLPKQPIHSLLSGQKVSKLRGRGLNFEEIRNYLPGDDVRNIDWKVTARMRGEAHIRVYTEERDRPVLLVVDQRINMFFGSVKYMKSVSAAYTAAIAAWRVLGVKDRVGGILFNDHTIEEIRPGSSVKRVMQFLKTLVRFNQALNVDGDHSPNPTQLNDALKQAARLASHDCLVVIISDMQGIDQTTQKLLTRISRHNDVIISHVFDPMEQRLPDEDGLVVTDGELQLPLKGKDQTLSSAFESNYQTLYQQVKRVLLKRDIPVIPINSALEPIDQIQKSLGYVRRAS